MVGTQIFGSGLAASVLTNAGATFGHSPRGAVAPVDLVAASRGILDEVRELPGVVRVFPRSSEITRWFSTPVTDFVEDGSSVRAWVTIGVDRYHPSGATVGLVGAYLRARLTESGFDFVQVLVRAALFA